MRKFQYAEKLKKKKKIEVTHLLSYLGIKNLV